jgi:topoisomerase IV subunit B
MGERSTWTNTTHDWFLTVDQEHLQLIRDHAGDYAATGVQHLILEILAYANDEAESLGRRGYCTVTFHRDESISVTDDGRGTDTRRNEHGRIVRKPVMATKDLRFFDQRTTVLPDGHSRRGMSVVAALSTWLEHTNHRIDGAWTQRYEYGVPVADLVGVSASPRSGTTVRFHPDPRLVADEAVDTKLCASFPWVAVTTVGG